MQAAETQVKPEAQAKVEATVSDRATTFSAVDDSGPPTSMKVFGSLFMGLWLGMLVLVFVARRRQLRLKATISAAERVLLASNNRG